MVLPDLEASTDPLDRLVLADLQVPRGLLACQDQQEHQDPLVTMDLQDSRAPRDQWARPAELDQLVWLDSPVPRVLLEHKVQPDQSEALDPLVRWVRLESLVHLVRKDQLVVRDSPVQLDLLGQLALRELRELLDFLVPLEILVTLESLDRMELSDSRDWSVRLVYLEPAHQAQSDLRDRVETLVSSEQRVRPGSPDHKVVPDCLELLDLSDCKDWLDQWDLLETPDLEVHKVQLVLRDSQEQLAP